MRGLFWILGLFFLAAAIALLAVHNDGLVLIVLPPWQVDFSLNFLILALLAAFILSYALIRTLLLAFSLPGRAKKWRAERQKEQAAQSLEKAINLFFEGRYGHALRHAESTWEKEGAQGAAALIAARSAQRMREAGKVAEWLEKARLSAPEAKAATLMIEAEMALELEDYQAALTHLENLQKHQGRHIAALRLELRTRQHLGHAAEVLKLSRQLEKRGGLQAEPAKAIRRKAHREAVLEFRDDARLLLGYYGKLRQEERSPNLAFIVAKNLQRLGENDAAARLVETALSEDEWSEDLILLYGQLGAEDEKTLRARIAKADGWLQRRYNDNALLFALGLLCERVKLWGKARNYLEASLSVKPERATHLALARLLDSLGETEAANIHFRKAAEQDKDEPAFNFSKPRLHP